MTIPKDEWIFTFGVGQALAGRYVVLKGTQEDTRAEMHRMFGAEWSFQYDYARGMDLVDEYSYQKLPVNSPLSV
jgi:hypothetical protein